MARLLTGIDCASYQGVVDMDVLKSNGHSFVWVKATEETYTNPFFAGNWAAARHAGLFRGAYAFARPTLQNPYNAALEFIRTVTAGGWFRFDMFCVDVEVGAGNVWPWVLAWLAVVEVHLGTVGLIYSGKWFTDAHPFVEDFPELARHGLWLAAPGAVGALIPSPWTFYAFRQAAMGVVVPGVVGPCDVDVFNGDVSQIQLYGAR